MKTYNLFLLLILFFAMSLSISAQNTQPTAQEEFETYERNFSQVGNVKNTKNKVVIKVKPNPPAGRKGVPQTKTTAAKTKPKPPTPNNVVGMPGMKIWLEKQVECDGAFSLVAPTSLFKTGDCVRTRFRLNFEGYLTVINYGSSGSISKIFPVDNQSNKIAPKTDFFIPDNAGWEFFEEPGNENLFFIVSNSPLIGDIAREIELQRNIETESSQDIQIYDRDLKPRTEKNEIFVLAGETRLEKPLIFRLTLKHR